MHTSPLAGRLGYTLRIPLHNVLYTQNTHTHVRCTFGQCLYIATAECASLLRSFTTYTHYKKRCAFLHGFKFTWVLIVQYIIIKNTDTQNTCIHMFVRTLYKYNCTYVHVNVRMTVHYTATRPSNHITVECRQWNALHSLEPTRPTFHTFHDT